MSFIEISPLEIKENPFKLIGKDWALLCAGTAKDYNMMTVSWGQTGVLWGVNTVTAFVRPFRHTKKFIDENGFFTLSFFEEKSRDALSLCGSKSGRDIDKKNIEGLTAVENEGAVYFKEAKLVLVCKKLYADELKENKFLYPETAKTFYPKKDFHTFYIGEIVKALVPGSYPG